MYIQLLSIQVKYMKLEHIIKSDVMLPWGKRTALNLFATHNVLTERYNEFFKQYDITSQQFNVLRILKGQKGKPTNLSTLNDRMIYKNSNTTRLVDKLINKGLSERIICPNNRRKVEITITRKGLALLDKIDPHLEILEKQQIKMLSLEELKTLNEILEKLRTL